MEMKMLNKIWLKVKPLLEKEFVRFLLVGGINTLIGYSVTLFLFYLLKFDYKLSQVLNFIICFPIAYTLQAKYAFQTKWSMKRLLVYPISSLPNFILQFITLVLCVEMFNIPEYIAYLISYIVPIPIMFVVVRFLVKEKDKDEVKDIKKSSYAESFLSYCLIYSVFFSIIFYFGFKDFLLEGNGSLIWYFDGVLQHFPFLYDLSEWFKSLATNLSDIPMWTWEMGFGADIVQSYSYYTLGDPFSLLAAALFPLNQVEFAYNIMAIFRIYLVGISLLAYCKYKNVKLLPSLTGSLIMAFSTHILFWGIRHPFFTNGAILLPLLFISIEEIFKKKKPYLFILLIAISAMNNFYFFYMNSLAIFIYAVVRFFFYVKEDRGKVFLQLFLKVVGFYLLGLSIAAIIFIPSTYGFLNTFRAGGASLPIGLFDIDTYKDTFTRLISFDFKNGISRITVASIALPCMLIFLTYRDKKIFSYKLLLGVFSLFLCIPFIYSVFNGFSSPNNRWVYIYLIIVSFVVAYTLNHKDKITKRGFILSIVGSLLYFALLHTNFDLMKTRAVLLPIVCIIAFYCILYVHYRVRVKSHRELKGNHWANVLVDVILLLIVTINLISNTKLLMLDRYYGSEFGERNAAQEAYSKDQTASFAKIQDDDFYRVDYHDTRNNQSLIHNFKGTHVYNSIIDKDVIELFEFNNVRTNLSSSAYMGLDNISSLEALLGVKYYISEKEDSPFVPYGFTPIHKDEKAVIYENKHHLALGFVYYDYIAKDKLKSLSPLDRLYAMLDGVVLEEAVKGIDESTIQRYSEAIDYEILDKDGVKVKDHKFIVSKKNGKMTIRVKNTQNKEVYLSIDRIFYKNPNKDFKVSVKVKDMKKTIETRNVQSPYYVDNRDYLYHIGYTDEDFMDITLSFSLKGEYDFKDLNFSAMPMEKYEDQINELKRTVLEDIEYGNNFVKGNVHLEDKGILYLSIPYTPGWEAYDNGKKISTFKANTAFTGLLLEEGSHEIYLQYKTPLLTPSIFISVAGACVFAYLIYYNRKKKA